MLLMLEKQQLCPASAWVVGVWDALGKLPVPGGPTNLIRVGQGPTVLAAGVGGGCLDIFSLFYHFSFLSPSLWEMARYRLKYCLKGPLSPKQSTNQHPCFCYSQTRQKQGRESRDCTARECCLIRQNLQCAL